MKLSVVACDYIAVHHVIAHHTPHSLVGKRLVMIMMLIVIIIVIILFSVHLLPLERFMFLSNVHNLNETH